jgi:hypothetical protein
LQTDLGQKGAKLNLQNSTIKMMAKLSLMLFVHFITFSYYPAQAQESLIITGFRVKTPVFKPYREKGRISFFLNMDASINVEIQDKEFNLVRSIVFMGDGVEGENVIAWDGRDEQGEFVKSGQYIFSITAQADNGSSTIISKDVAIEFDAPMGTEFKTYVTEIEGKPKKPHVHEAPEKFKAKSCLAPTGSCLGGLGLIGLGTVLFAMGAKDNAEEEQEGGEGTAGNWVY